MLSERPYGVNHVAGIMFTLGFLWYAVYISDTVLPKSKSIDAPLNEFSGDRARKSLVTITNIGPRPSGSYANDILAVETILSILNKIKTNANKKFHIDIELQHASGSFAFVRKNKFIDLGFTSAYGNITNILVKMSVNKDEKLFVLANAHFDTVMNTEGASDDTISCAVLIEIFRTITRSDPSKLKYGLIFLLNGAEEGGLSGSHAFVNEHRWASIVKAVINVEAAGSGGREFVFQTGPENPWILQAYAKAAKYPFASVVAQEIFESGVIPSDTDFRVFVQYGKMVGIDLAFISNGYIYHTRYDNAKAIPSGSIQRAGDNIHGLVLEMVNSPYLVNPKEYKHGSTVFFDILGYVVVHYPKRIQILLNSITAGAAILYILQRLVRKQFSSKREHVGLRTSIEHFSVASIFLAILTIVLSYVAAVAFAMAVAMFLTKIGYVLSWYSRPTETILLYGLPALVGMMFAHFIGNKIIKKFTYASICSFIYAHLLIYAAIILYINQYEISSSFLIWLWLVFPFFVLCLPHDFINFLPEMRDNGIFALHILSNIPPLVITLYHIRTLYSFFGPLLGRTGTELPPDYVMAGLTSFGVVIVFTNFMTIYQRANNMKRCLVIFTILACLPTLRVILFGGQPFSVSNGVITPKRMFIQHTYRTFYNADNSIRKQDSGILMQPMDYSSIKPIQHLKELNDLKSIPCEGSYCGLPYYYPMRKVMRQQYLLAGETPEGLIPFTPGIYTREVKDDGVVRFNFNLKGPSHMVLFLTLKDGVKLADWSLYKSFDGQIYSMNDYVDNKQVYYVFYSHGYYAEQWKFWIDLKASGHQSELAEIGIARHYLYGKPARTDLLRHVLKALPEWLCDNSWTSNYDSFILS